jgi:hypothetical protein
MVTKTQAAQPQMGLTFEKVWAMFQETDRLIKENAAEIRETTAQMKETDKKFQKTERLVKELSKNIGGVTCTLGKLTEAMYSARLWDKFAALGYEFTCGCRNKKFMEKKQTLAEADIFLENGIYAMPVEIKTDLTIEDVDEHLERIAVIRQYMDERGNKRLLVGAVAGGVAPENVVKYAQKKGLYVVVQSGESVTIAEAPESFKAAQW